MTDHIPGPLLPVQERIWDMKYRLKEADGTPIDVTIEDTWMRVATALAAVEDDAESWRKDFYAALKDFKFIPAGRILAGAGTDRRVTLFNCFVMGRIGDSMESIFDNLKEAALTMQQGGGIGYDFSTLRPAGALVQSVAADASGPLPFMDTWDAMCRTIMSAGSRRGAMMGCLRCDHPDIEAFIEAKRDAARFRMFNLSVLVTDDFMGAVEAGDPWNLVFEGKVFKTVDARVLWRKILQATYDVADPGVIFIDRMNRDNNLAYCEEIFATNPCGEQPLPPYGACDLGSINLAALVRKPFTADADIDLENLRDLVKIAVRMLDNVVDVSNYPLTAQRDEARMKRRIGLGVTGLANALFMCGKRYTGTEAKALVDVWMTAFRDTAYLASVELAQEKGPFPLYDLEAFACSKTVQRLPRTIRTAIAESGIRNGLLTSIAPTGTISLLAGNISSGVEPVFAASILRKVLMPDGTHEESTISDYGIHRYREAYPHMHLIPPDFVTADDLTPTEHLTMQAQMQGYIDSAISKTINCPQDIDFDDFRNVYSTAYDLGCKGCTTYRPNPTTGSVLEAADIAPGKIVTLPSNAPPLERSEVVEGRTYKMRWPLSDHAIYITINDMLVDGQRRPIEIFINSKNMEHYAWTVAFTRMASAVFRKGGDVSFVVEELKAVFDPRGGAFLDGKHVPSVQAAIGGVIEQHLQKIGLLEQGESGSLPPGPPLGAQKSPPLCPRCSQPALKHQDGCETCTSCGYSNCG